MMPKVMEDTWLDQAACNNTNLPIDAWFPEPGEHNLTTHNVAAFEACVSCPVIPECRERLPNFVGVGDHVLMIWGRRLLEHRGSRSKLVVCGKCGDRVPVSGVDGLCVECSAGWRKVKR